MWPDFQDGGFTWSYNVENTMASPNQQDNTVVEYRILSQNPAFNQMGFPSSHWKSACSFFILTKLLGWFKTWVLEKLRATSRIEPKGARNISVKFKPVDYFFFTVANYFSYEVTRDFLLLPSILVFFSKLKKFAFYLKVYL